MNSINLQIQVGKPVLFVLVGISASGKSTVAQELINLNPNTCRVSSDSIRKLICPDGENEQSMNDEVFRIYHDSIRTFLRDGQNVIADATNITMRSRRGILNSVKGIDCYKVAVVLTKTKEDCINNNNNRERHVPEEVIERQIARYQIPFYEEGFDMIYVQGFDKDDINKRRHNAVWLEEKYHNTFNFDQKNPWHQLTLGEHMRHSATLMANKRFNITITEKNAACLHDIGKMFSQTFDENGVAHYYNHANVGAHYLLTNFTNAFSSQLNDFLDILFLVNYHMLPFNWDKEHTHNKWKNRFGEEKYQWLIDFHECDKAAEKY